MQRIPVRYLNTSQKEPQLSTGFSIRDIHGLLGENDLVQELHRHDFFYLLALKCGQGEHVIDFNPYLIADHNLFFMRPGQVHQLRLNAGSQGYLIQFDAAFYFPKDRTALQLLRKASTVDCYQLHAAGFQKLQRMLDVIAAEDNEREEQYEEVIKAQLGILFIELIRQKKGPANDKTSLYQQERLEEFIALLEVQIFTHKQVDQYAEMLNLSPYQLNAITKAALGKTCSEVINDQIVLEAKRCLLATSNQINQTAYRLGYEDVSYFIRFFKKQTGYSPEAFRNNSR